MAAATLLQFHVDPKECTALAADLSSRRSPQPATMASTDRSIAPRVAKLNAVCMRVPAGALLLPFLFSTVFTPEPLSDRYTKQDAFGFDVCDAWTRNRTEIPLRMCLRASVSGKPFALTRRAALLRTVLSITLNLLAFLGQPSNAAASMMDDSLQTALKCCTFLLALPSSSPRANDRDATQRGAKSAWVLASLASSSHELLFFCEQKSLETATRCAYDKRVCGQRQERLRSSLAFSLSSL